MANILERFSDIMKSNIHALLDSAEDPEKMIDQYLRNMESDLGKVKSETAAVMAEESRTARRVDDSKGTITKLENYAARAVQAGNDEDAKIFLQRKNEEIIKLNALEASYEVSKNNSSKVRSMHDKLSADIHELHRRKSEIKAKLAVAKAQERSNKFLGSFNDTNSNFSAFDAIEEKANFLIDQANAMAELNTPQEDPAEKLARQYDASAGNNDALVADELAALKSKLCAPNQ